MILMTAIPAGARAATRFIGEVPEVVTRELSRALPFANAQIVASRFRSALSCKIDSAELVQPIASSGPATLRVTGRASNGAPCTAYAFVDVKLTADALVATRPIREGESLEGAVRLVRREIIRGETPITALPEGVVATRSLAPGQLIDAQLFRDAALMPGSPVRVQVRTGALLLEETGHIVACGGVRAADHACATVLSGKRVEGTYASGALVVATP